MRHTTATSCSLSIPFLLSDSPLSYYHSPTVLTINESLNACSRRILARALGGKRADHRRLGLGKAVVLHAMHQMKAAGVEIATVANEGDNEASRLLYKSCGFEPWHLIDDYSKGI